MYIYIIIIIIYIIYIIYTYTLSTREQDTIPWVVSSYPCVIQQQWKYLLH